MKMARRTTALVIATLSLVVMLLPISASLAVRSAPKAITPNISSESVLNFGVGGRKINNSAFDFENLKPVENANAFALLRLASSSSRYSSICTWNNISPETDDMKAPQLQTILRSAMLSINSFGPKKISISASMLSRRSVYRMGLSSLKLQYYAGGRWMTVFGLGNSYVYNSESYYYSTIRANMLSRGYYRVSATFLFTEQNVTSTMTRTTANIRCR